MVDNVGYVCVLIVRRRTRSRYRTHVETDSLQGRIILYYYYYLATVAFTPSSVRRIMQIFKYSRIRAKLLRSLLLESVCL